jgi:SynChlorMet cassette radical SAM/SPASM protein ScmF
VPPLTSFYLYLTNGCNLACRHCWISPKFVDGEPDPGDCLDLELLKKAVREAKPLGLRSAKLTGGEPTLHPHFVEIVDYLTAEGLSLTMETNGTLIDEALARHLKEKSSLRHVSVSIDGPNDEIHDSFRGVKGSFEAAVQGFKNLVEMGYRPQVIMSIHRDNLASIEEVVDLALKLNAGSVKFNPVLQMGRGQKMHQQHEILDVEWIFNIISFIRGPLQEDTPVRLIIDTPLALYSVKDLVGRRKTGACRILNILGILGSGDTALCGVGTTIPELCFGNLRLNTVTAIWRQNSTLQLLRTKIRSSDYSGICKSCIHVKQCLTWCPALNYQNTGELISPAWFCMQAYRDGIFPETRLKT